MVVASTTGRNNGRGGWGAPRPLVSRRRMSPRSRAMASSSSIWTATAPPTCWSASAFRRCRATTQTAEHAGSAISCAYPRGAPHRPPFELGRVRLADLDGDGVIDAACVDRTGARHVPQPRPRRLAGTGGRTRAPATSTSPIRRTSFADMTGDGLPDLVQVRCGDVEYRMNLGHGRFSEPNPHGRQPAARTTRCKRRADPARSTSTATAAAT